MSKGEYQWLKSEWDKYQPQNFEVANKQRDEFLKWTNQFIQDSNSGENLNKPLENLSLEKYTSLINSKRDNEYFTYWLETKTKDCGTYATSSYGYGIYLPKKQEEGRPSQYRNREKELLDVKKSEDYFRSSVLPIINGLKKFEDLDSTSPIDINYARKVAYLFNVDKLLPLFKKGVIQSIAIFFDIKNVDENSYKATNTILNWFIEQNWIDQNPNFEITKKLGDFLFRYFGESFPLDHKNIIFYGAPGTGKTHTVLKGLKQSLSLARAKESEVLCFTQFHPSYSYEDFIEGIRPKSLPKGGIELKLESGGFKRLCKRAMANLIEATEKNQLPQNYYFVADEINRAELSRVLGEVLVCLEESKRVKFKMVDGKPIVNSDSGSLLVETQHAHLDSEAEAVYFSDGKCYFGVPENLYFIGTMNDIDRSIDSFDLALRRRFVWRQMGCSYKVIKEELEKRFPGHSDIDAYLDACEDLNNLITSSAPQGWELGDSYQIGHGYFLDLEKLSNKSRRDLFELKIAPLLTEYLRSEYSNTEIKEKLKVARAKFLVA